MAFGKRQSRDDGARIGMGHLNSGVLVSGVMGFLRHIQRCNRHSPSDFVPFCVDDQLVGRFRHDVAERLVQWSELFNKKQGYLTLNASLTGYGPRTEALHEMLQQWVDSGEHAYLLGERYPVTAGRREAALFEIDRSAATLFGLRTFGQHINGYVRKGDDLYMWVAKRANDKRTFPGMLDQMVAGGLPASETLLGNLCKECREEADIAPELARSATPVGALSYNVDTDIGYKYDILYCYDLELPKVFSPRCTDGEVDQFLLMPVSEVMERVFETDEFKPNCNLVIIDFLLRHGLIDPEHEDYLELVTGLRPAMRLPDWSKDV
jgi:8-oxo-dGTP pyrophosphatase MutT (NUDIX family)